MMELEFIHKVTMKMLRFEDKLLDCRTLLMFRIHDMVECVKDSISTQQILSIGNKSSGRVYPPSNTVPIVMFSCCSDPDFFTRVLRNAIGCLDLFYPDNIKHVCDLVKEYFRSCFVCSNTGDPASSLKTVVVVEVVRKFLYIGLQAEELRESILDNIARDDEDDDYSESDLQDILGSVCSLKTSYNFSTNVPTETYRLSQVKAAVRLLSFNGNNSMDIDDDDEEEKEKEKEDQCPICLEGFRQGQQIARMPCSHTFHRKCAFEWLLGRGSCPLCRSKCKTQIIL